MMLPDLINSAFEAIGGLFILNHCRVLYRDKQVKGVSKLSTAVFFVWGIWNLFYYPHLDQWASFAGGLVIVSGNCLWLGMMLHYARPMLGSHGGEAR
jgi:hypothetical protein